MLVQFEEFVDDRNEDGKSVWEAWFLLISSCFNTSPELRPTFASLHAKLKAMFEQQDALLPSARDIGSMIKRMAKIGYRQDRKSLKILFEGQDVNESQGPAAGTKDVLYTTEVCPRASRVALCFLN